MSIITFDHTAYWVLQDRQPPALRDLPDEALDRCLRRSPRGLFCTLGKGHVGNHVAHGYEFRRGGYYVMQVWIPETGEAP